MDEIAGLHIKELVASDCIIVFKKLRKLFNSWCIGRLVLQSLANG